MPRLVSADEWIQKAPEPPDICKLEKLGIEDWKEPFRMARHPTPILAFQAAVNISVSGVTNEACHPSQSRTTSMQWHRRRGEKQERRNERQSNTPADGEKSKEPLNLVAKQ